MRKERIITIKKRKREKGREREREGKKGGRRRENEGRREIEREREKGVIRYLLNCLISFFIVFMLIPSVSSFNFCKLKERLIPLSSFYNGPIENLKKNEKEQNLQNGGNTPTKLVKILGIFHH